MPERTYMKYLQTFLFAMLPVYFFWLCMVLILGVPGGEIQAQFDLTGFRQASGFAILEGGIVTFILWMAEVAER
jgi:succinate-acetate transporter protein